MTRGQTMADPGLGPESARPEPAGDHPHGVDPHSRHPDVSLLAVGGFAVVTAVATLAVNAAYNQGHVVPPLDDVYIHLQYARQLGLGEFLRYQPGAPPTTGASSLLYVLLLGVVAVVVPSGLLLHAALALGVVCFAGTVVLVALLGRALASRRAGTVAAVLTALCGPLLWGATSGMEVGLVALLATATLLAFVREQHEGRFRVLPWLATLLVLTRPEGLVLVVAVLLGVAATLVARHRRGLDPAGRLVPVATRCLVPLAAALGQFLLYRLLTGSAENSGITAKSWFSRSLGSPLEVLDRVVATVQTALQLVGGVATTEVAGPGVAVLVALGLAALALGRPPRRIVAGVLGLGLAGVLLAVATLQTALWQDGRYLQPFLPVVVLLAVLGTRAVGRAAADARRGRVLTAGIVAVLLAFGLVSAPTWALRGGQQASGIRESAVSVSQWLHGHTPPTAVVGVNDAGAVAWFSGRRVVDLVGLTTPGLARPALEGSGAMYEALAHLPVDRRPTYFSVFDHTELLPVGELQAARIFGDRPLVSFDAKSPDRDPGPFGGICQTTGDCRVISVWRADWSHVGSGDAPDAPVPGRVVDHLNVGDLADEAAHGYGVDRALVGLGDSTEVRSQADPGGRVVVDSGRHVVGGEHFVLRGLTPGRPVTLTARVDAREPVADRNTEAGVVAVGADGHRVGDWAFATGPGSWAQSSVTIPGPDVRSGTLEVTLGPRQPYLAPYPDYHSFGYWASQ
ncbi:hypothetical protein [Actinomycetospora sp. TBRC 11914]|uniref:hypothetical protein n=1 Tax=Actinomycetospora sp. TBRC 11914 TaxID=2729387 RepID=UPI00145FABF6|nr:hypothetical protein [Actinomycetospora sp. TBRC 11914]NMO90050.1 hypothetical protein [Actinomycetospora sp. TBRC 11914]